MRFGTDGVRGRANTELTPAFALNLGRAAARVLDADHAVVGGDSRISTPMLEAAFVAGLAAEGVEVHRLGVTPTPAVAFEAQRLGAMGAVISASHNAFHDNGIKLFAPGGTKLPDEVEARIEAALESLGDPTGDPAPIHGRGASAEGYIDHLLAVLEGRDLTGMGVVVDAANGAASHLAADVLQRTGARTIVVNAQPDGTNINAGCGATDPAGLQAVVTAERAHVGIALDGDADRLIAVDEQGQVVDGDHIIAICATDLRARGLLHDDTVVVTVMTNLGFRLAMEEAGITVVETPVGDRYVLEALAAGGYSLGGEQSGHVIFSDHARTGDGLMTALQVLGILARTGKRLSELTADFERYPQVLLNIAVLKKPPLESLPTVQESIRRVEAELAGQGRVLIRYSGTELKARVMVEGQDERRVGEYASDLADVLRRAVQGES